MNEFQQAFDSARTSGPESWTWNYDEGQWLAYCPHTDGIITGVNGDLDEDPVKLYRIESARKAKQQRDFLANATPDDCIPF